MYQSLKDEVDVPKLVAYLTSTSILDSMWFVVAPRIDSRKTCV